MKSSKRLTPINRLKSSKRLTKRPTPINRLGRRARLAINLPDEIIFTHPHRGSRRHPFQCRTCGDDLPLKGEVYPDPEKQKQDEIGRLQMNDHLRNLS